MANPNPNPNPNSNPNPHPHPHPAQISEKRAMNKHAMTPLEATLNRDLLLSIAAGESYEPTSIFD